MGRTRSLTVAALIVRLLRRKKSLSCYLREIDMPSTSTPWEPRSLAEVLTSIADIPHHRILLPVGTATEKDCLRAWDDGNK